MNDGRKVHGYLPNGTPPTGLLILLGFQYVLTMFPTTMFVAAFAGFRVGTVLLASGLSTIVALTLCKRGIGSFIRLSKTVPDALTEIPRSLWGNDWLGGRKYSPG
jgi:xanthine/uracil permease